MTQPSVAVAVVELALGDRTLVLTPTLRAAQEINRRCGSLSGALQGIAQLNLETFAAVIRAGAKLTDAQAKEVEEELFAFGLAKATGPLARFLTLLLNGGRDPDAEERKPAGESSGGN